MGEWRAALLYVRAACRRQTLHVVRLHVRGACRKQVVRLCSVTEEQGRQGDKEINKTQHWLNPSYPLTALFCPILSIIPSL
ncbi:MAG: hypothetical protein RM022_026845 [Nostoc sp. EfeVER01]|uniref:hypothetical protein n=1 Tax=unclassified Nostoc TaxID=2593658 RepID=UPI002AD3B8CE|nr:hypothetical protein [Nostoc sp. EspVER01]MDZ7944796.1 hypothetical protein [Nostoc sp. EfeVER01]MDZ7994111.1 hypothetical protein [Nostoc sp. EspVER01]